VASTDTAILDAAIDLLAQRGYRGTTVAAVAAAAGVSEPTVYLRYRTKHELTVAAIARRPFLTDPHDTGDITTDLIALLTDVIETGAAIGLGIVGVVLAEEAEHPELLARWRATVGSAASRGIEKIIERGRQRGQVPAGVKPGIVADLVIGAYLAHYTHKGRPNRAWARQVVETLRPVLT
jgi:AcrR family transcriptional regulator